MLLPVKLLLNTEIMTIQLPINYLNIVVELLKGQIGLIDFVTYVANKM